MSLINFAKNLSIDVLITSVNYEDRCLGITSIIGDDVIFENSFVFIFESDKQKTQKNLETLQNILKKKSKNYVAIKASEDKPLDSIIKFCSKINDTHNMSKIIIDITTIPIKNLLILLKTIDDLELWKNIRIYYTEPLGYNVDLCLPMSIGIGKIQTVDEFIGNTSSSSQSLLLEFLGYSGDRARAVYNFYEPDETVLIIPKPPFNLSWEGKTERLNNTLLKMVGDDNVIYARSNMCNPSNGYFRKN